MYRSSVIIAASLSVLFLISASTLSKANPPIAPANAPTDFEDDKTADYERVNIWVRVNLSEEKKLAQERSKKKLLDTAESVIPKGQTGLLRRYEIFVNGFVRDLFERKDLTLKEVEDIVENQIKYNQRISSEAEKSTTKEALLEFAEKKERDECIKNGIEPKSFTPKDPNKPAWSADRETFFVGVTRFGGPKDMQRFSQADGSKVVAPNVSAYDQTEYIPAGLNIDRCEFGLPGRVPDGMAILVRVVDQNGNYVKDSTPTVAYRSDLGPMITNDYYWKTKGKKSNATASSNNFSMVLIKKAKKGKVTTSDMRKDPSLDPLAKNKPIPKNNATFPMRALDLTPGCWSQLGRPKSNWAYVKWQFIKAPQQTLPEIRPKAVWAMSKKKNYFNKSRSLAQFPGKTWDWWNPRNNGWLAQTLKQQASAATATATAAAAVPPPQPPSAPAPKKVTAQPKTVTTKPAAPPAARKPSAVNPSPSPSPKPKAVPSKGGMRGDSDSRNIGDVKFNDVRKSFRR